jgi:hypothetical protein
VRHLERGLTGGIGATERENEEGEDNDEEEEVREG